MMVSTRGRYALRIMIDLAQHQREGYTAMKCVAERQGISLKYLEKILPLLVKEKLLEGMTGKGGGYRLTRPPEAYRVGDILRATEGDLVPVPCLERDAQPCARAGECPTLPFWQGLDACVRGYLDSATLADLIRRE